MRLKAISIHKSQKGFISIKADEIRQITRVKTETFNPIQGLVPLIMFAVSFACGYKGSRSDFTFFPDIIL